MDGWMDGWMDEWMCTSHGPQEAHAPQQKNPSAPFHGEKNE
jgi:hypothetical protein